MALIAKCLQGGEPGHRNGCGLLEADGGWLGHQVLLRGDRVLGEGALARAEDLIPGLEPRRVLADRFDDPGHV